MITQLITQCLKWATLRKFIIKNERTRMVTTVCNVKNSNKKTSYHSNFGFLAV